MSGLPNFCNKLISLSQNNNGISATYLLIRHNFQIFSLSSFFHYWESFGVVIWKYEQWAQRCDSSHEIHPHRTAEPKHNSRNYQNNVPLRVTCSFMLQPLDGQKLHSEALTYRKGYCIKVNVYISADYLALEEFGEKYSYWDCQLGLVSVWVRFGAHSI